MMAVSTNDGRYEFTHASSHIRIRMWSFKGSPTTRDSAIGSPTTRDSAIGSPTIRDTSRVVSSWRWYEFTHASSHIRIRIRSIDHTILYLRLGTPPIYHVVVVWLYGWFVVLDPIQAVLAWPCLSVVVWLCRWFVVLDPSPPRNITWKSVVSTNDGRTSKFRQDWRNGTRSLVTIKYVGNEYLFPTILGCDKEEEYHSRRVRKM